jgi:hypothetical protein
MLKKEGLKSSSDNLHIFRGSLCLLYTCSGMSDMTKNCLSSETISIISNIPL